MAKKRRFRKQVGMRKFANFVISFRTNKALSVEEFAALSGLCDATIYKLENGRTKYLRQETVAKFAAALGISPAAVNNAIRTQMTMNSILGKKAKKVKVKKTKKVKKAKKKAKNLSFGGGSFENPKKLSEKLKFDVWELDNSLTDKDLIDILRVRKFGDREEVCFTIFTGHKEELDQLKNYLLVWWDRARPWGSEVKEFVQNQDRWQESQKYHA